MWNLNPLNPDPYLSVQMDQIPYAIADTPAGYLIGGDKGVATLYPHSISEARRQACRSVGEPIQKQEWVAVAPGVDPVTPCGRKNH